MPKNFLRQNFYNTYSVETISLEQTINDYDAHNLAARIIWSGFGYKGNNLSATEAFDDFFWQELGDAIESPENHTAVYGHGSSQHFVITSIPHADPNGEVDRRLYYSFEKEEWTQRVINKPRGQVRIGKDYTKALHFSLLAPGKAMPHCRAKRPNSGFKATTKAMPPHFDEKSKSFPGLQIMLLASVHPDTGAVVKHCLQQDMHGWRRLHLGGEERVQNSLFDTLLKSPPKFISINKLREWQNTQDSFTYHNDICAKITKKSVRSICLPDDIDDTTTDVSMRSRLNGLYRKLFWLEHYHQDLPMTVLRDQDTALREFTLLEQWETVILAEKSAYTTQLRRIPTFLLPINKKIFVDLINIKKLNASDCLRALLKAYGCEINDENIELNSALFTKVAKTSAQLDPIWLLLQLECPLEKESLQYFINDAVTLLQSLDESTKKKINQMVIDCCGDDLALLEKWFKNIPDELIEEPKHVALKNGQEVYHEYCLHNIATAIVRDEDAVSHITYLINRTFVKLARKNTDFSTKEEVQSILTVTSRVFNRENGQELLAKCILNVVNNARFSMNIDQADFLFYTIIVSEIPLQHVLEFVTHLKSLKTAYPSLMLQIVFNYILLDPIHKNKVAKKTEYAILKLFKEECTHWSAKEFLSKIRDGKIIIPEHAVFLVYSLLLKAIADHVDDLGYVNREKSWNLIKALIQTLADENIQLSKILYLLDGISQCQIPHLVNGWELLTPLFKVVCDMATLEMESLGHRSEAIESLHIGPLFNKAWQDNKEMIKHRKTAYDFFAKQFERSPNKNEQESVIVYSNPNVFNSVGELSKTLSRKHGYLRNATELAKTKHRAIYAKTTLYSSKKQLIPLSVIAVVAPNLRADHLPFNNRSDRSVFLKTKYVLNTETYSTAMLNLWRFVITAARDQHHNKPINIVSPLVGGGAYLEGTSINTVASSIEISINMLIKAMNEYSKSQPDAAPLTVHICIPRDTSVQMDNFTVFRRLVSLGKINPLHQGSLICSGNDIFALIQRLHLNQQTTHDMLLVNPSSDLIPGGGCYQDNPNNQHYSPFYSAANTGYHTSNTPASFNTPGSFNSGPKALEEVLSHLTSMMYSICADQNPAFTLNKICHVVYDAEGRCQVIPDVYSSRIHVLKSITGNSQLIAMKPILHPLSYCERITIAIQKIFKMTVEYDAQCWHDQSDSSAAKNAKIALSEALIYQKSLKTYEVIQALLPQINSVAECLSLYHLINSHRKTLCYHPVKKSNGLDFTPTLIWSKIIRLLQNRIGECSNHSVAISQDLQYQMDNLFSEILLPEGWALLKSTVTQKALQPKSAADNIEADKASEPVIEPDAEVLSPSTM